MWFGHNAGTRKIHHNLIVLVCIRSNGHFRIIFDQIGRLESDLNHDKITCRNDGFAFKVMAESPFSKAEGGNSQIGSTSVFKTKVDGFDLIQRDITKSNIFRGDNEFRRNACARKTDDQR